MFSVQDFWLGSGAEVRMLETWERQGSSFMSHGLGFRV